MTSFRRYLPVRFEYLNAQDQRKFVWPASFVKARATDALKVRLLSAAVTELATGR